ncbi:macro domain-containing protein [Mucilaginibacter sp. CSA2-8R]|uniref:macro domain-containing protein n=1 Tax=Mucilaginibacter sp. CSA2-8R TaxID=3141542 RepID=UPI00315D6EDE
MISYVTGDLLQSDADALVNAVNTVGVMGKGIALQFKQAFIHNFNVYAVACKNKELQPGKMLAVKDHNPVYGEKLIVNFPTKVHWRNPSKLEYIQDGLVALRQLIIDENIRSIAIPPLGAGNGGLNWAEVKPLMVNALQDLDAVVQVYEPH